MSSKHKMRVLINRLLAHLIIFATLIVSTAAKIPMAKPNCPETCGNVAIPYPFGIGDPNCYLNPWYEITCSNNSISRPFLRKFNLEVLELSLDCNQSTDTMMVVNHPVYSTCRDGTSWNSTDLRGSPFKFSFLNTFLTVGCENILMMNRKKEVFAGCPSTCRGESPSSSGCQTTIPSEHDFYSLTYATVNTSACTYAFLATSPEFQTNFSSDPLVINGGKDHVPVFLRWKVPSSDFPVANKNNEAYDCYVQENYMYNCQCGYYHEGNPYIENGCRVISACAKCNGKCEEYEGGLFYCRQNKIIARTLGGGALIVIIVVFCFGMYKIIKRWKEQKLKKKFFKRNGGLLLQQQLSSKEDSFDTTKIFTVKELEKATDNFNISRVLGQGGQGTVYKGMLMDGMIVAVKKSTLVHERQLEQFINEVVILSQINHRNIVKLLGCCLETEVPLLVYEFISNGTLSQLIRSQKDEFPLSWKMRLQIASEISGALAYLHSASSVPIYHRDIKSSNILLDDKYRAKVADFGTSRSVAIDQTHLTTIVQGTFGYLDPEFFRSSQFTDKSDVYSLGVVLAELLTGEKPIISRVGQEEKSLASFFILALEEDSLFDIMDGRVAREGSKDEVIALAILARRCLNLNGRQRPTMKELMFEIERIRISQMSSNISKKFHLIQSISEGNQNVEDNFSSASAPFLDCTGNPSSEFHVAR
ncbi:unnamed protein product [Rhodiola kirilowii]